MDSPLGKYDEWKPQHLCRCCSKNKLCFKDITSENYFYGQKEVYSDMIEDIFNIQLSYEDGKGTNSRMICQECILRLRDAADFRKMVLRSEKNFVQCFNKLGNDIDISQQEVLMVPEVKVESRMSCEDDGSDFDDENLANLKMEMSTGREAGVLERNKERRYSERRTTLRKCKLKDDVTEDHETPHNDWSRILASRGDGPLLRENSLKLLANSTICVFQWNKSRYRCFCCMEPYSDIKQLKLHTETNHTLQEIEKKIILQQNRLVKVEMSRIECRQCGAALDSMDSLRSHLIDIHKEKFSLQEDLLVPFKIEPELKCQICKEEFSTFRLLNIHVNKHFLKQICHICGEGFPNAVFLNRHKSRSHNPVCCRQCDVNFKTPAEKRRHDAISHGKKYERKLRFPCTFCNERFFQEDLRVRHLVDKHGMKKPEIKCLLCDKSFLTRSLCNNHVKCVHLKEKNQECDICHNLFYTKSDLKRHRVTHTGEKTFSCALCKNNTFCSKDSLRKHTKRMHAN